MKQRARLHADQRAWLTALIESKEANTGFTADAAARLWRVEGRVANCRLWLLKHGGLVDEESDASRWRVAPLMRLALGDDVRQWEARGS